jgi:anionic cell wall polymer biosynthesis LytR-Cps2A-Psr (LCP) family protein
VNLPGFVHLVDSVGGVVVNVTDGFCDPHYDEYGVDGFGVSPGRYRMDGKEALAYARVRKAAGESDFTRAARQQEVIAALRDRIVRGAFLDNPGRFLRSLGQTISTNVRPGLIADYVTRRWHPAMDVLHGHPAPLVKSGYDERGSIQILLTGSGRYARLATDRVRPQA